MTADGGTQPLPRIPAPAPTGAGRRSHGLRFLEALAGLLSAGLIAIGVVLVLLQLSASALAPGEGISAASGPTWARALGQLCVGAMGEFLRFYRPRMGTATRTWLALAVVIVSVAVIWVAWWA